jgi:hypothetical protein|tara:strand:+ start:3319 stop:4581 length:1263 start_codon:yes stop_codon:yes gene_type:complete
MAIKTLKEIYGSINRTEFDKLIKNRVIVTEKISSVSLHVQRTSEGLEFFKSNGNKPMTIIDRTLSSLYEMSIEYIKGLDSSKIGEMPHDWKFGFEYLPTLEVANIKYDNIPTNTLILTHIHQVNEEGKVKKVLTDPKILTKWSTTLGVQAPSIVFDGYLDFGQRSALRELLSEKLNKYGYEASGKTSFTKVLYNIFDKNIHETSLNNSLDKEIDSLVLTFNDNNKVKTYKIEDSFRKLNEEKSSNHVYQITVLDLLEYLTVYDFSKIKLTEETSNKRYIEAISVIFNEYISENATKYIGVDFKGAAFSKNELFNINKTFINNETTLKYIDNSMLSELFKITLGTFRKKKNKANDILSEDLVKVLNTIVGKIEEKIFVESTDENNTYNYNDFVLHNKVKDSKNLSESTDDDTLTFNQFITK